MNELTASPPPPPLLMKIEKRHEIIREACTSSVQYGMLFTSLQKAVAENPKILNCSPTSVLDAMLAAAKLGIDPNGEHNSAWFIPYGQDLKLMIGFNGYIDLITRSSTWHSVTAECVYHGEAFEVHGGTRNEIIHGLDISKRDKPDQIVGAYAIANGPGGAHQFAVLDRAAINRSQGASKNKRLWQGHERPEMVKKTAVRMLAKQMVLDRIGKFAVAVADDAHGFRMGGTATGDPDDLRASVGAMLQEPERDPDTGEIIPAHIGEETTE